MAASTSDGLAQAGPREVAAAPPSVGILGRNRARRGRRPQPGATVDVVGSSGDVPRPRARIRLSSQIRARVWTFERGREPSTPHSSPPPRARRRVAAPARTCSTAHGACRLVFSESDGLPGLIVDRYGEYLVCQFLSAGAEAWRSTIVELLAELCAPRGIYERSEGGRASQGRSAVTA